MRRTHHVLILVVTTLFASGRPAAPIDESHLQSIGRGMAIVFSPDLAPPTTCSFYSRLGFLCIRDASWRLAISKIASVNRSSRNGGSVHTVIIESHGANGNTLKLQDGRRETDKRSYASVAALDERLYANGVRTCIINACNAGRLFRPEAYRALDPWAFDRLLLPATSGELIPSAAYDRANPRVAFLIPRLNQLQSLTVGDVREFDAQTRTRLGLEAGSYVISDTLIQVLLRKRPAAVVPAQGTYVLTRTTLSAQRGEQLFREFRTWLDDQAR